MAHDLDNRKHNDEYYLVGIGHLLICGRCFICKLHILYMISPHVHITHIKNRIQVRQMSTFLASHMYSLDYFQGNGLLT